MPRSRGADLVLATDPDADRLGVFALDRASGEYKSLTGNMSGVLVCDYLLRRRKELGILPANGAVVSTIVSTNMVRTVTEAFGMKYIDVLTGFKFIGEQMRLFERDHTYSFQFGMEESYGCLVGTHARDKDAVVAVMALCEAAAWCYCQGKTLWDRMGAVPGVRLLPGGHRQPDLPRPGGRRQDRLHPGVSAGQSPANRGPLQGPQNPGLPEAHRPGPGHRSGHPHRPA